MLNLFRAVLLLLSFVVPTPGAWAADPPANDKKLTVMLDWFVNPDHAALIVAQEKGFFAAQNLEVDLQTPPIPTIRPSWSPPARSIWRLPTSRNCISTSTPACRSSASAPWSQPR